MNRRPSRLLLSKVILAAALVAVLCCTAQKRHDVLTFFFDGVPPLESTEKKPASPAATGAAATPTAQAPAVTESVHPPARDEGGCGVCHNREASFALLKPKDQLCITCHVDKTRQYPYLHGPAAVGDCAECHDPHRSPLPHLLRTPVARLCFQCHERTSAGAKPSPCVRPSDEALCTDCHNPHGGAARFFLVSRPAGGPASGAAAAPGAAPEAQHP